MVFTSTFEGFLCMDWALINFFQIGFYSETLIPTSAFAQKQLNAHACIPDPLGTFPDLSTHKWTWSSMVYLCYTIHKL